MEESRKKKIIYGICFFAFLLLIQLRNIYEVWFDPDELDVYLTAAQIARGNVLYRDVASQHMPFTYLFSAFFWLIGARKVYLQRLCFYILFAFFWTGFSFRYKKYVNKWIFLLHPILFLTFMQTQEFCTQILSENLGIIGAEIFALEFIRFIEEKDIDIKGCILMSVAVLFTFGATFVAIYPLFFLAVGVFATEIKWRIEDKTPRGEWWKIILKRYLRLLGIVLIPWVGYAIYALATGSLDDCVFQAYVINREYYPKYIKIGGSVLDGFFLPFMKFAEEFTELQLNDITLLEVLRIICLCTGGLYFPYRFGRKKGIIAGLTMWLFVLGWGERGYFHFHGKVVVALISMLTVSVLIEKTFRNKDSFNKAGLARKAFLVTVVTLIFAYYAENLSDNIGFIFKTETNFYEKDTDVILAVTDKDEPMWQTNICNTVALVAERDVVGGAIAAPWMWEGIGEAQFSEIKKNPPKAVLFDKNYTCWEVDQSEYAKDAYDFILANYTFMPESDQIWIRNDYYDEACKKYEKYMESKTD